MINNKFHKPIRLVILLWFITALLSCANTTRLDINQKPALIQAADKLLNQGVTSYGRYDYPKAEIFFAQALHAYRGIDNPEGIVSACINLGKTYMAMGNMFRASAFLKKAKTFINSSPGLIKSNLVAHLIIVESSIQIAQHRYVQAEAILQPLLDAQQQPGREHYSSEIIMAALQNRVRIAVAVHKDEALWLQRYEQLIEASSSPQENRKARLARFKAALSKDSKEQDRYYAKALNGYRKTASPTGIAATLEEWGQQQIQLGLYPEATDKLERALFIRTGLQDKKHTIAVLTLLHGIYQRQDSKPKARKTQQWLERIASGDFYDWNKLAADYTVYP